jgi:hypothetical protein
VGPYPVTYTENNQGVTRNRVWEIYEVSGAATVAPLSYLPAVMTGLGDGAREWEKAGVAYWQDADRGDVPRAADGPDSWPRVGAFDADAPRRRVTPASVSRIHTGDETISFDVDRVGVPVLVKTSYFPNWKVSGADGPYRVTPNQMVVVPRSEHVELHYGYTGPDLLGMGLTALGLAGAAAFIVFDRRRRRDMEVETGAVVSDADQPVLVSAVVGAQGGAEAHQAPHGAHAAPHDGGAGGTLFDHGDGDLGDEEPGPLRSQDELGVEEVGPESALLDDR